MVIVGSSKLTLPIPSLSPSSPQITSLLFEPISSSLALIHSDSSISLYPSLSPFSHSSSSPSSSSSSSLSFPQTLIPSPSSSSTFLLLQTENPNPTHDSVNGSEPRVLFIVAGPHGGGSRILLRFYALRKDKQGFVRARVICNQKGIEFDRRSGVLFSLTHGIKVGITGSVNYFVLHSVSSSKIFVFGMKLADGGDDDGTVAVKLIKCAVVECCRPVWSINISSGLLVLGEDNGVRVLNLRELVKGKVKRLKNKVSLNEKSDGKRFRSKNGVIRDDASHGGLSCNGYLCEKNDKHSAPVKQRTSNHRPVSSEASSYFLAFIEKELDDAESKTYQLMSNKAISIHALSIRRFLIVDSSGDLHVLHVSGSSLGSNFTCHIRQLPRFMEVQKLVLPPEISVDSIVAGARNFWITDGDHSLHMVTICNEKTAMNEKDEDKSEETLVQVSAEVMQFMCSCSSSLSSWRNVDLKTYRRRPSWWSSGTWNLQINRSCKWPHFGIILRAARCFLMRWSFFHLCQKQSED